MVVVNYSELKKVLLSYLVEYYAFLCCFLYIFIYSYLVADICAQNIDMMGESKICENGGTCTSIQNYYTCDCGPGYAGRRCQIGKFFVRLFHVDPQVAIS